MEVSRAIDLIDDKMCWGRGTFSVHHMPEYDEYWQAGEMAIDALKKQEEDRWVSVTERLPEYGTEVLTQLSDNDIVTNWVIDEEDEEWFEDDVIAWRPLPELFQEEE